MSAIYKRKKAVETQKTKKVVGAYLPLPLIEFMTLQAMDRSVSMGCIIEEQLNFMVKRCNDEGLDLNYLIHSLACKAKAEYADRVVKNKAISDRTFFIFLKKELELNGNLTAGVIDLILNAVKNG
jgi:transcriptional regulator